MARRFTLQLIMDLATRIGANPSKLAGTRTNISFLGKGPAKNPLFQSRLAGLENASAENLGKPETLFGAIEDAVGWAKDGKLNSIQTEILGHNLSGINKILNPPPLPTASVTAIRPGIEGLRRFPKESHKFFGRPLKDKDFSEIDRMVMEGKIPDARGRTWNLKVPETGPAAFNAALNQKTGMSRAIARQILQQDTRIKLKPEELFMLRSGKGEPLDLMRKYYGRSMMNLDSFLDDVIPRPNMNIKDIATRVLSEVELTPQFAEGGLAEILQAPRKRYAKGSGRGRQDPMGGHAHQTAQEMREAAPDQFGGGMNISHGGDGPTITTGDTGQNFNVSPIQTFKDQENKYLDKFGAGINRNKAYAAGLLSLEDVMEGSIKPDLYAGYSGDNFNIAGQKTKDMTGVDASAMIGPVNVQGSYQDYDGDVNKNISATSNLGGVDFGVNYNFENNPTFAASYNTDNFSGGLTYDGEPKAMFSFSKKLEPRPKILGKNYAKGGLAGILEV